MREREVAHHAQLLERHVRKPALAVGRDRQAAGIRLRPAHQLVDGLERRLGVADDAEIVRGRERDRHEILRHVVGHVPARVRQHRHVAALPAAERVAVRRRLGDQIEPEHAARPRPVLDHHLLAEPLAHLRRDEAAHDVHRLPRREGNNESDGLVGIALRIRHRRQKNRYEENQNLHIQSSGIIGRSTYGFFSKCSVTLPPNTSSGRSVGSSCVNGPQPFIGFFMLESVAAAKSCS